MNVLSLADAMPPRAPLQKNTGKNGVFAALPARAGACFPAVERYNQTFNDAVKP
jgi:hypothetical protein